MIEILFRILSGISGIPLASAVKKKICPEQLKNTKDKLQQNEIEKGMDK